jgi:hypothetical protein
LAVVLSLALSARAAEQGSIWGRILGRNHQPLTAAWVVIRFPLSGLELKTTSNAAGCFCLSGIPPGLFSVRVESPGFKPYEGREFVSEPASALSFEVTLCPLSEKGRNSEARVLAPHSDFSQTILSNSSEEGLPSGNNIWNLVENQDLSATSSRIDVGGLWTGVPALLSGRGSVSWTQSAFLLNGMDFTDPYQGGTPLFYPDFWSWDSIRLVNADFPVEVISPGAYLDMTTPPESPTWHGGLSAFYADKNFTSSNITPALVKENLTDDDTLHRLADFHFHLTGPLSKRTSFYASLTSQSMSRDIAQFSPDDVSSILSGMVGVEFRLSEGSCLNLLWAGQDVRDDHQGAAPLVDPAATTQARNIYNVLQAVWEKRFSESHSFRAGLGFASGSLRSDFQADALGPNRSDLFFGQDQGVAPEADRDARLVINAFAQGQASLGEPASTHHLLEYGLNLKYTQASSQKTIRDGMHLIFFEDQPIEVVKFNTPTEDREAALHLNLYGQETLYLGRLLSVTAGFNLRFSHGWVPGTAPSPQAGWASLTPSDGGRISWLNLSPRLSVDLALSDTRASYIRLSAARYYYTLPLNYLAYGNPGALGGLVYSWNDANGDRLFQDAEASTLLRRQGPLFGRVDPNLKSPSVDELMLALSIDLGRRWTLSFAGYLRETRNLVAALNTGVPFSAYDAVTLHDNGDDAIPGDWDDLTFTVYNQKPEALGRDFFLLTNADADTRVSRYRGADLTLIKRPGGPFDFFFSFQAIEAIGWANPGNSALENDDGVIGSLYADPNTLINAKGRLRFDRGFTVRTGFSLKTVAGITIGAVIKYYDGQPFARQIIVTGFNQGPFYIMAHTRGVARYEYNRTVDVRLEKDFRLGPTRLCLILDGFNIFNRSLATKQNEWSGPDFGLRFATEVQSPRMFRLGIGFEF